MGVKVGWGVLWIIMAPFGFDICGQSCNVCFRQKDNSLFNSCIRLAVSKTMPQFRHKTPCNSLWSLTTVSSSYTYKCCHYGSFPLSKRRSRRRKVLLVAPLGFPHRTPPRGRGCFSRMITFQHHHGALYFMVWLWKSRGARGALPLPLSINRLQR